VDYRIELDDELSAEIEAAREASREAEQLQRKAAARWRAVARQLSKDRRMTGSDVAAVLDVSPQRVSQLLNLDPYRPIIRRPHAASSACSCREQLPVAACQRAGCSTYA
jgi:hypothetical protein